MKTKYPASASVGDILPQTDSRTFESRTYAKVSRRLIPFLMLCYLGAYLDRVNVGFAKLQMLNDLRFSETIYGMGAGIFFLGYFLFEVPSNLVLHRVGARKWLARIMLTWAVISASFVFVKSPTAFYVLRFMLGVAEAGFAPGVILYLTYWFPAARRAKALSLFFMAIPLAGMIGGPLSGWIMHSLQGTLSLSGWKWLFVLEALPSLVLGVAILLYLDDSIVKAKWLTESEKTLLARNVDGDNAHKIAHISVKSFIGDRRLWLMAGIYFCVVLGQYGLTFWLPTIIRKAGVADPLWVGAFTAIPYLCAIIALPLIGMSADRHRERRLHLAIPMLIAAAAFASTADARQRPGIHRLSERCRSGHPRLLFTVLVFADGLARRHVRRSRNRGRELRGQPRRLLFPGDRGLAERSHRQIDRRTDLHLSRRHARRRSRLSGAREVSEPLNPFNHSD